MKALLEEGAPHDPEHPRPMLRRGGWFGLDGPWEFAIEVRPRWRRPADIELDRVIEVPFAPETRRSGIASTGLYGACWYRRRVQLPPLHAEERMLLCFNAVDYEARVWVNGVLAVAHEGGYTPFSCDITELLGEDGGCEIVVQALDDPSDLAKPRGKQDWRPEPHSIWYPRTTGIWQTVWCERVPATRIAELEWNTSLERWEVGMHARILGAVGRELRLRLRLRTGGELLTDDVYAVVAGEVHRRVAMSDPGIDDFRNELLWSPESPTLLDAELTLLDREDGVVDQVLSYTALRSFVAEGNRFLLNGRPYPLRMVLDQGYWPETGMTPPNGWALRRDVELTRMMGFNGARKHQKIEDPRYLYWADRLGLLVWEEMPSAYRFTGRSVERLMRQWIEVLHRDISHPCIVAWVPFNESWGVPNLPDSAAEQNYVRALYHATKTIDPVRPVVGNDGWESVVTDIIGIHDYDGDAARLGRRYDSRDMLPRLLEHERPGGRALVIGLGETTKHPVVLSEFGGITCSDDPRAWGYTSCSSVAALEASYTALVTTVRSLELFAGFCYTQLADTYQEANGLLYADRTPKLPIERIAAVTGGGERIEPPVPGSKIGRNESP
jgi:beta-galactosidase/beta-glucuronidase